MATGMASNAQAAPSAENKSNPRPDERELKAVHDRYMQGANEPVTSSVLISNSKYLNSPYYRDAFAHQALRRHGHDLPATYNVPKMMKAMAEVADYAAAGRLIAEEKAKNADFGAWVDARRLTAYHADMVQHYADGTLGAAIRAFLAAGMDIQFLKIPEINSDLQYIVQRRAWLHDIEHMVTGFGPDTVGEAALAISNVTVFASYFTPELAQFFNEANCFVGAGGYMRTSLHYHRVIPAYLDGMRQGIALGQTLKRPLFMEPWEDYLDWTLENIAIHFGFQRGPGDAWAWTTEAASG
jgi:ubiquinone biosynthesis protein COQ4